MSLSLRGTADEIDDFNDNAIDPAAWSDIRVSAADSLLWLPSAQIPAGTQLVEQKQRLEFTNAGADLLCLRPWILESGIGAVPTEDIDA